MWTKQLWVLLLELNFHDGFLFLVFVIFREQCVRQRLTLKINQLYYYLTVCLVDIHKRHFGLKTFYAIFFLLPLVHLKLKWRKHNNLKICTICRKWTRVNKAQGEYEGSMANKHCSDNRSTYAWNSLSHWEKEKKIILKYLFLIG